MAISYSEPSRLVSRR